MWNLQNWDGLLSLGGGEGRGEKQTVASVKS